MREIMCDYVYIALLFIACAYFIIQQTILFNNRKYNPYIFGNGDRDGKQLILDIVWVIVLNLSLQHINNPLIVQLFLVLFFLCINTLNYLSYVKIRDQKIIYLTIIFDIIVIILMILMFKIPSKE